MCSLVCRYADPDADADARYDGFTDAHRAIVEERARLRQRQFSRHTLGARRPRSSNRSNPGCCEMLPERDEEDDEWEDGHINRREELVESFMIAWDQGRAEWLSFPGTRRRQ